MRVRIGFVSNSSSCSFICPICGFEDYGFDSEERICSKCGGIERCPHCGKVIKTNVKMIVGEHFG